jgi:ribosomal protein S4E
MHLKRNKVPKLWGLRRKGTKYVVRSSHDLKSGVPVLVILRDILKLTKTREDAKEKTNSNKP